MRAPVTKSMVDKALREFERAHRVWMNTPVWTLSGAQAKAAKDAAMDRYSAVRERYERARAEGLFGPGGEA